MRALEVSACDEAAGTDAVCRVERVAHESVSHGESGE
jgi:hypothetical protein